MKDITIRCNCKDRERCPFNGNFLIDNIIYKATVRKEEYYNYQL